MNTNEIHGDKITQWFFSEVHLLADKLVPVVAIHPFRGSWANRHHTPNLQPGAAQPTQDVNSQATLNPLELSFVVSHGEGTKPPHNPPIGAGDKHHPPLNDPRCSKLSRCRQTPRVTREIHSKTQSPSVSISNHSSNALGCSPILSNDESIKQDELERVG
jgi:hypothetical protein